MSNLSEYAQIFESIAVIAASGAALYGVNTWKKEAQWKKETVFNEEVMFSFYACQETIRYIRSFVKFDINNSTYIPSNKLSDSQNESLRCAQIVFDRYNKHIDTFNNLNKLKLRYKAIYPKKSIKPFTEIEECVRDIMRAARMLGTHYWHIDNSGKSEEVANATNQKIAEYESILYYEYSDPDIIDNKITEAIKQLESSLIQKT